MTLDYHVVDVFAEAPFQGNPLAVVLDADDLSSTAMQTIAQEFNLSETTFPIRTDTAGADYRLRIFTPSVELPFAGHPSVGTAWLLHHVGRVAGGEIVQECGAGLLPVLVDVDGARLTGGSPVVGDRMDPAPLLAAVGLADENLTPGLAPRVAGTGIDYAYIPVQPDAVARAVPDTARLLALPHHEVYVVSYDRASRAAHARMFGAGVGVDEDPATGSAALGLGVWLAAEGVVDPDATTSYAVRQGIEMGRPSLMTCTVTTDGGVAVSTTVAGRVFPVAQGSIRAT